MDITGFHCNSEFIRDENTQLHGTYGRQACLIKACVNAEEVILYDLCNDLENFLLHYGLRLFQILWLGNRLWKCFFVNLTVLSDWHFLQLDKYLRNHIVCQGFCCIIGKLLRTDLTVCNKITAEILIIHRYGNAGNNSLIRIDYLFNLPKLNSQSAKLDLVIHSSEKLNLTFRTDPCKVTGLVGSLSVQVNKDSSCLFRQIHIASAHSKACDHKLSCLAVRNNVVLLVHNIDLNITVRNTDGNIFTVSDHLHSTANSSFCRSITVHNVGIRIYSADLVIQSRRKSLCTYIKYLNLRNCFFKLRQINHIGQISRGCGHNVYFIFEYQFAQHKRVQNFLIRGDHCSHSVRQRQKFLQHRYVKGHGCHGKRHTSSAYIAIGFCIFRIRIYKVGKVDMLDQNTLWFASGTGSIDTITKIMLPNLYLGIVCILILQQFLQKKYRTGKLCKQLFSLLCDLPSCDNKRRS